MGEQRVVVGLDVGTTKICTLIGEIQDDRVQVVGIGVTPSRGIRKGIVVDMDEAAAAISTSIKKAETFSGYKIVGAYLAVSGSHISSQLVRGRLSLSGKRPISKQDVAEVLDRARPSALPEGRRMLHLLPKAYVVDGEEGVHNPLGMLASILEVEGLLVTASEAPLQNLAWCVERAGIKIDDFVCAGLASAQAALSDVERQLGALLIDFGAGSTDFVWVAGQDVQSVGALPFGGNHITNDLSMVLGLPFAAAEELKAAFASATPAHVAGDEMVDVGSLSDGEEKSVPRRLIAEVVEARVAEMLELLLEDLKEGGFDGVLPAGVVLTGAGAHLRGLRETVQDFFKVPARAGDPEGLAAAADPVVNPAYSTVFGLLRWVSAQPGDLASSRPVSRGRAGLLGWIMSVFRTFFP
jgi:cell division protein FtsA